MSRDQKLKMKESGELVANLFCLDKLTGIFGKRINITNFLRLKWMYKKFKIKVLNDSRLYLGT